MDKGLWFVTLPITAMAVWALAKGVPLLRTALHVDELAALPLATGGDVEIRQAGEVILSLRGSLGSRDFAKAFFDLRDSAGKPVPSSMIVARSLRTDLAGETTLAVRRFTIPAPGRYRLDARGIDPGLIAHNSRLILSIPAGSKAALYVIWVVLAALALLGSLVFSVLSFGQTAPAAVSVPAVGSASRTVIVDAVRRSLGIAGGASRLTVFHLRTAAGWAYFEGNEIVLVENRQWQETDLTVKALLQQAGGSWQVRALWSLPDNERLSLSTFERQVRELRNRAQIATEIFPASMMAADVKSPSGGPTNQVEIVQAPAKPMAAAGARVQDALIAAIKAADLAAAQAAVGRGADVRAAGPFQRTVLHEAAKTVNPQLIEWLLAQGADHHARDGDGRTPLHLANALSAAVLLRHGADVHLVDRQGNSALHLAAESDGQLCQQLVAAGVAVNGRNYAGLTALHFAVLRGKQPVAAALLKLGADVNAKTASEYLYKWSYIAWDVKGMEETVSAGATPVSLARQRHQKERWSAGRTYQELTEFLVGQGAVERKWWQLWD